MQHAPADQAGQRQSLDKRLAVLFWALLFILAGALWLFPSSAVPDGTWLVGIGLILLSLNAVRVLNGIPVRVLPSLLGALALVAGLAQYAGMELPVFSLTLIAIGASIILELVSARRT
jgi:hypothetical protein